MSRLKENLLFTLVFAASLAIILACGESQETTEQDISGKATDIRVSAVRLFKDYEANEVAADEKYKSKILEVSGAVEDIGKDILDQIYVTLKTGEYEIFHIQCFFSDAHKNAAAQLRKGQRITVKGKCDGKLGNVMIKGCVIR